MPADQGDMRTCDFDWPEPWNTRCRGPHRYYIARVPFVGPRVMFMTNDRAQARTILTGLAHGATGANRLVVLFYRHRPSPGFGMGKLDAYSVRRGAVRPVRYESVRELLEGP